jgi:N-acetylneuraminic acid mutarotase
VSGSTERDSSAGYSYGTLGVASTSNQPGARSGHGFAADRGVLWMVGGTGVSSASSAQRLNDVWRYDVTAHLWTW